MSRLGRTVYYPLDTITDILQALSAGCGVEAKHIRDDIWLSVEKWDDPPDFENYRYRARND